MSLPEILNLLLSGTTITGFIIAWKSRNAQVQITETNAIQELQKAYRDFIADNRAEVEDLKKEVLRLRTELEQHKNQCRNCKAA
ncbi:hypothetical protein [Flavobacterium alkalisoli]|uniref:hypothetical protein n=1 Tax=Flavobacterium alkalisoli TaxID=2602769 RepID=UPI003A9292D8